MNSSHTLQKRFFKDNDNNIYERNRIFYIVNNNESLAKLHKLESKRYFYISLIPATLILPITFIGVPLSTIINEYFFKDIPIYLSSFMIGSFIYLCLLFLYNKKISNILKDCEVINKEEILTIIKVEKVEIKNLKTKENREYEKNNKMKFSVFHYLMFLLIGAPFILFVLSIISAFIFEE